MDHAGTAAAMRREAERLLAASADGHAGGRAGGSAAATAGESAIGEAAGAGAATAREAVPGGAWTWLAERHDGPVGVIATQRPEHATWIAPLTRLDAGCLRPLWTIWEARPARTLGFARTVAHPAESSQATGQNRHTI